MIYLVHPVTTPVERSLRDSITIDVDDVALTSPHDLVPEEFPMVFEEPTDDSHFDSVYIKWRILIIIK